MLLLARCHACAGSVAHRGNFVQGMTSVGRRNYEVCRFLMCTRQRERCQGKKARQGTSKRCRTSVFHVEGLSCSGAVHVGCAGRPRTPSAVLTCACFASAALHGSSSLAALTFACHRVDCTACLLMHVRTDMCLPPRRLQCVPAHRAGLLKRVRPDGVLRHLQI